MFFALSKILWPFADPANVVLAVLLIGAFLLWGRRRYSLGRPLVMLATLAFLAAAVFPVGKMMLQGLENRFAQTGKLPDQVAGIIVLGGMVDQFVSEARGEVSLGQGSARLTAFADLARRYPGAKLVFTGGSGRLLDQSVKETQAIRPFLASLGVPTDQVVFEDQSRNTYENAILSAQLVGPRPGEPWILITSAFHMPRAVGVFRKAGWTVVPYPVSYDTTGKVEWSDLSFDLIGGLLPLSTAVHEWLGLTFYYLTGRTSSFYPAPNPEN